MGARTAKNAGPARGALAGAVTCAIFVATSCREPTVVLVEARTNVPFRQGLRTTFTVGTPGENEGSPPSTSAAGPWGSDGFIGSLAVVPGSADDAPLSIKLVMGIDRDPSECSAMDGAGCIISRRRIRYRPHEKLVLPITLYAQCKGVPCDADTTCNALGLCVPAATECAAETCTTPGELPDGGFSDGAAASPDGATDGANASDGADASDASDAKKDANASDAGPTGPGTIDCPPTRCAPFQQCCYDLATGTGTCFATGGLCAGFPPASITCDSKDDCLASTCCGIPDGTLCMASCGAGPTVCGGDGDCIPPKKCTGPYLTHYRICQ